MMVLWLLKDEDLDRALSLAGLPAEAEARLRTRFAEIEVTRLVLPDGPEVLAAVHQGLGQLWTAMQSGPRYALVVALPRIEALLDTPEADRAPALALALRELCAGVRALLEAPAQVN